MAEILVGNATVWVAQYDFSAWMNAVALNAKAETPETTAMGVTSKQRLGGLLDHAFEANGWWDAEAVTGNPDHYLFDEVGLAFPAVSLSATGAINDTAYLLRPELTEYSPGAKVGDVMAFKLHGEGSGLLVKGSILLPKANRSISANSTGVQLGAVTAGQSIYAALHVFTESGTDSPHLDVKIQSHDDNSFGGGTVDRITFAQKSAAGYEWATPVAGPITDTWWRVVYTITGTNPIFNFAVTFGIR